MDFSKQEYWNGLPFLPPGDHPNSGTEPMSLACLALAGVFFTRKPPEKTYEKHMGLKNKLAMKTLAIKLFEIMYM